MYIINEIKNGNIINLIFDKKLSATNFNDDSDKIIIIRPVVKSKILYL